ncbi:unnamed protein product [Protopolystoma xenopodis]|uniref:PDZ domain-containing protein n=1 Tax=Protopolystoma xenopodis TaxID=117903 RepID=A0A448WIK5_9PLAT|nr:unnamed protein product [Protopolystoma xenopodis]
MTREPSNPSGPGFGFSIAGGSDSPYFSTNPGIFVTRIAANGVAELDGRIRQVVL